MGAVWLARDLQGGKPVVVKVMHPHVAAKPAFRERFARETALMARLQHANAVAFLAAAEDQTAGPFIVMEYVAGQPLDKILARHGPFAPARLLRLLLQLCAVLTAAHEQKIVHCDLKPANMMVLDFDSPAEKLKVMDFGLAQLSEQPEAKEDDGERSYAVGTPGYMPPEQVRGEPVDHRGDIYSVGVILYRLLSGRLPFVGATTMDLLMAQATGEPPTFSDLGLADAVAPAVEAVVRSCLAADPAARPQSARELGRAYREAAAASYSDLELSTTSAALIQALAAPHPPTEPDGDPDTVTEEMEAWLPEAMAEYKLRGFAEAIGGEIVENSPGLVRVKVSRPKEEPKPAGLLSFFGLRRKPERGAPDPDIDIELHLRPKDPAKRGLLQVTVLVRPAGVSPAPANFRTRCVAIGHILRSFLMC
jgi:serine/threonine-protein kinase